MHAVSVENLIILLTPVFSGLICIVLVLLRSPVWKNVKGTGLRPSLLAFYGLTVFNWAMLVYFAFFPLKFVYVRLLLICGGMMVPVMLYRFMFILTRTDAKEKFSMWHYAFPAAVLLIYAVWSMGVPEDVFRQTSLFSGREVTGYRGFYILISLAVPLRFLVGIIYSVMGILRYRRYRRYMADYSSDIGMGSLHWVKIFFVLWVCFLVVPVFGMLVPLKSFLFGSQAVIPAILLFAQNMWLCFNAIRGNFIVVSAEKNGKQEMIGAKSDRRQPLDPEHFNSFLVEHKPFLNPELTIADLACSLSVNRSYLSSFINKTYGMNFSQVINEYRLSELERIVVNPSYSRFSNTEKIAAAGFGSYYSYRRALKMQEERKLLLPD